jgi:hypothetical protein
VLGPHVLYFTQIAMMMPLDLHHGPLVTSALSVAQLEPHVQGSHLLRKATLLCEFVLWSHHSPFPLKPKKIFKQVGCESYMIPVRILSLRDKNQVH